MRHLQLPRPHATFCAHDRTMLVCWMHPVVTGIGHGFLGHQERDGKFVADKEVSPPLTRGRGGEANPAGRDRHAGVGSPVPVHYQLVAAEPGSQPLPPLTGTDAARG